MWPCDNASWRKCDRLHFQLLTNNGRRKWQHNTSLYRLSGVPRLIGLVKRGFLFCSGMSVCSAWLANAPRHTFRHCRCVVRLERMWGKWEHWNEWSPLYASKLSAAGTADINTLCITRSIFGLFLCVSSLLHTVQYAGFLLNSPISTILCSLHIL